MKKEILALVVIASGVLCACANAKAASIDPTNDIDCSALAVYFSGLADHLEVSSHQRHSARKMHEWYSQKVRDSVRKGKDSKEILKQFEPVFNKVKLNHVAVRDEMISCTKRAINDPSFEEFARQPLRNPL